MTVTSQELQKYHRCNKHPKRLVYRWLPETGRDCVPLVGFGFSNCVAFSCQSTNLVALNLTNSVHSFYIPVQIHCEDFVQCAAAQKL